MASFFSYTHTYLLFISLLVFQLNLSFGHDSHHSGSGTSAAHGGHHHCDHGHHHHHHHQEVEEKNKLPEELAEEEDLKLYGFGDVSHYTDHDHHDHHHHGQGGALDLSGLGLWIHAMGCSLLVSLASLICLIILPLILIQGKPSKAMVDSLAVFGAGAMLGDAFLHQLPHAFGGEHSHSHSHDEPNAHHHVHLEHSHSHSHSLQDLSVGLSILAGIVLFLFVEKVVRYVDEMSGGVHHGHHHHHHQYKSIKELKDDDDDVHDDKPSNETGESRSDEKVIGEQEHGDGTAVLRKRSTSTSTGEDKPNVNAANDSTIKSKSVVEKEQGQSPPNLVFGYLNLFSDGVHNFTDGMALGSAFLLYGSVGGWSRTLFLLAHELPQEIGDFGILVRSGFSVSKALFFNFLSALVALAGTALALMWGQDPGQSSLIEGFTAGGFIYIAVAGVLAEMNNGSSSIRSTATQLISLILGMSVALCISLFE